MCAQHWRPRGIEVRLLVERCAGCGEVRAAGPVEAGVQYALRIRNACLVAAAFADAGITAIITDTIINEGFESLTEVPGSI